MIYRACHRKGVGLNYLYLAEKRVSKRVGEIPRAYWRLMA